MPEQPIAATPGSTPATPATPAAPAATPAAPGTPAAAAEDDKEFIKVPVKQYRNLERDAARYRGRKSPEGTKDRYQQPPAAGEENDDPELAKARSEAEQTRRENLQLKLSNQVRDLLETDAYKDLSTAAKRILKSNPMAIVDPRARNLEDAIADIKDFMDDELAESGKVTVPVPGAAPAPGQPGKTPETPPVGGGKPAPTNDTAEESVEGKTGSDRSVTILKNIMKRGPAKK